MLDVFVDSLNVKVVRILRRKHVDRLHAEHELKHLLGCVEEDIFVLVAEVEGFWEDSEELGLQEANTEPSVNN